MPKFNGREFYTFGLAIALYYSTEVAFRTAIGRVYYACYHVGSNAATNKGWFSPSYSARDHSSLRKALKDHSSRGLADQLFQLYTLREHVDYHIEIFNHPDCEYCQLIATGNDSASLDVWNKAKEIASHILPKLESIDPSRQV